jgi:hypothetical protein
LIIFCVIAAAFSTTGGCEDTSSPPSQFSGAVSILVADSRDVEAYKSHHAINLSTATISLALEQTKVPLNFEYASVERSEILMEENRPLCATNRIKTAERLAKFLFSKPINLYLKRRIYQHVSALPLDENLLDDQGRIKNLADIFQFLPNKIVILPKGVAYIPELAEQISAISENNIYYREGGDLFQIPMMFEKGRGDFILEFPAVVYELLNTSLPLRSYKLSANDGYAQGHLMCTDTAETRQLLQQLDKGLITLYEDGKLLNAHLQWLPESDHQDFSLLFLKVFNSH